MTDLIDNKLNFISDSFESFFESLPIGIIVFDENGIIKLVNNNFFSFGIENAEDNNLIDKNIEETRFCSIFNLSNEIRTIKNEEHFEKEIKSSKTLSGGDINLIIKGAPQLENGIYKGGILLIEDLSLGIDLQQEKVFSSSYFNKLIKSLYDCFLLLDINKKMVLSSAKPVLNQFSYISNIITGAEPTYNFKDMAQLDEAFQTLYGEKKIVSQIFKTKGKTVESSVNITFVPFTGTSDEIVYALLLFKDVSDEVIAKQKIEAEIQELQKYAHIANAITDAIINIDMQGRIIFWNDSASQLFGVDKNEVFGKYFGKILPAIDENYLQILIDELKTNKTWQGEFWSSESTKESELLSIRMALVEKENFVTILCTSITERANIERELRVSEERFRNIVTNTREYICTFNIEGNLTYINPFFSKEFGYSEEEFFLLNLKDLLDTDAYEKDNFELEKFYNDKSDSVELTLLKKDGTKVYVIGNFNAAKDISGKIIYYNAVFTDISVKKRAEKDLLMIRTVFEASQDGITIQQNRNYILANDSFVNMFGYSSANEIIGRDLLDFVFDEDIDLVDNYLTKFIDGQDVPNRFLYRGKRKGGSDFHVEKTSSSYETADGQFIVSTYRDITNEKKALDALEISEERYRSITENINDCVWSAERLDGKLKMVFYSEVIIKITGYTNQNFLTDQKLWLRILHPSDAANFVSKLKAFYHDITRVSSQFEYRIINNLGSVVWIKNKINVLRGDDGKIQKVFGLTSDITLSKRAEEELKKSADDLKILNETKDRFISIISHDLRTPFSSILGFTDMLLSDRNLSEDKQIQYISYIQESSRNMLSLVNGLLDWTRLQTGRIQFEPQRLNAKYIITKSIQMLSGVALQKNINLVSDLVNDVYVHADENLLLQVINNLVSNAIKFTGQGGIISISSAPLVRQRQVQFKIKDTGTGIKEEDIPKLFKVDTKFTTSGTEGEKGSGLGLSLCYDIVKKHGGEIAVNSEFGKGTEMIFTIPVSSTKILLVDDSRNDRILYSKLLKNFISSNYSVDEASNGKEAYDKIKNTYPALIITDHNMPVMNGYSLVQQLNLSEIKYKPPIIVLSSDLTDNIIKDYKALGIDFVFKKPVNLTALKFAVDKSLKKPIVS
ncbi:MAG: PAS domain S-box protein [Bacteroidetes bacterium]|nr:PAS domain S-box protein [Bacteroidota bacterium]